MNALASALLVAGHLFTFEGQPEVLLMLPAGHDACGIGAVSYGTVDGKFSKVFEAPAKPSSCQFRQTVNPGELIGFWDRQGGVPPAPASFEINYSVESKAGVKEQTATISSEPARLGEGHKLKASFTKGAGRSARVQVTNDGPDAVLLGDAVAARNRPSDSCRGGGPTVVLQAGETLTDTRPGLVSKSMQTWVAVFKDLKQCNWVRAQGR